MNQGVTTVIFQRLPKTLVLVGISTVLALVVAVPLGILQVVRRNKPIDYILTGPPSSSTPCLRSCSGRC